MITLDTDLSLISRLFNISAMRISQYAGKSIDEIMEAEAAQGNTAASKFGKDVLGDPIKLIQLFKLFDPNNKFAILHNMNVRDLKALLPLLEKEDMVFGLNFFAKDQILKLYEQIPKQELIKLVFELFSPKQVMELMPEREFDKLLTSHELDRELVFKHLKTMPPQVLAQMLEATTGQPVKSMDSTEMIKNIAQLSPEKYKEALLNIPLKHKREFVARMTADQPKLYQLFSASSYCRILNQKEKPDLVKSAHVLNPDSLVKMLGKLPKDLMSIVLTQIDPKKFADVLTSQYQEILKKVVAG